MTPKPKMWWRVVKKCRCFAMCLNLSNFISKTSRFSYESTYMNPMITTNQKPAIVTKNKRYTTIPLKKNIKAQEKKLKEEKNRKTKKQPGDR